MTKKAPKTDTNLLKITELEERLARSLADYVNLEKRTSSQREFFVKLASSAIVAKLIDCLDDFNLAQAHLKDAGLQIAIDKLYNVLKSEGLEEVDVLGKDFDHNTMDCVQTVPGEDNKVISVNKKAYLLNGECLRPAQVVVGKSNV